MTIPPQRPYGLRSHKASDTNQLKSPQATKGSRHGVAALLQRGAFALTTETTIPERIYLTREEAAAWLSVSVDTFASLGIPYCDLGPRIRRWSIIDIIAFMDDTRTCDSARTSTTRRRHLCVSSNATAHRSGGHHGTTPKVEDAAKALGLTIKS